MLNDLKQEKEEKEQRKHLGKRKQKKAWKNFETSYKKTLFQGDDNDEEEEDMVLDHLDLDLMDEDIGDEENSGRKRRRN